MVPGAFLRNKAGGKCFNPVTDRGSGYVRADAVQPGDDTDDVSIHSGNGNVVCNGGDGTGGIRPNARDLAQLLRIAGKDAAVFLHDLLRAFPEVPGPRIVSQAFPCLEHILFRRFRKGGDRREALQETGIIRKDSLHAGLLKHGFADPGAVCVMKAAPRQIPGAAVIP